MKTETHLLFHWNCTIYLALTALSEVKQEKIEVMKIFLQEKFVYWSY